MCACWTRTWDGADFKRGVVNFSLAGDHISIFRAHNELLASADKKSAQRFRFYRPAIHNLIPALLKRIAILTLGSSSKAEMPVRKFVEMIFFAPALSLSHFPR